MKVYEGMFLLDPALASDWPAAEEEINRVLGRADAKVLGIRNWDERRLAYQIGRHKRGLYALTYFTAPADKLAGIERDVQLSEKCLRALLLRKEKMSEEDIQRSLAAEPPKPYSRYEDRGPRPDRGDRGGRSRPEEKPAETATATATAEKPEATSSAAPAEGAAAAPASAAPEKAPESAVPPAAETAGGEESKPAE